MIEFEDEKVERQAPKSSASIKVMGIGGAGGNTINSMIDTNHSGIDFFAANTDAQALDMSKSKNKVQFGVKATKGLGTGADPELGRRAAEEDIDKMMEHLDNADIVFLTAGMGGGTGSGALPVIARALKERGILSIAVVTKPFLFEGKRRTEIAEEAIDLIKKDVDTLIVIPNQKLLEVVDENVPMVEAFSMINDVLNQSVKGISDIIAKPGHINVDYADVRAIMKGMGYAVMGNGRASGKDRAREAALSSVSSPLLENMSIKGAKGVLLNITGGPDMSLYEINQAANVIYEQVDENASIILGSVIDQDLTDEIFVTVIATGFENEHSTQPSEFSFRASGASVEINDESDAENLEFKEEDSPMEHSEATSEQGGSNEAQEEEYMLNDSNQEGDNSQEYAPVVDISDLDIPTFLRNKVEEGSSEETPED
ncbi:cell division protein FtsZ [bacterium]|jgi:cell division protein FtsZ|nr:cell division protein FtsZ [bacterium]